ncbi:hypothetical protein ABZX65_26515 [Streptomyces sp. NPDC003300]|uniref:hypothetical protein n=1 Tax=unclassified Streptomyces TaxID=2593676 RepID=UPI0033B559DC
MTETDTTPTATIDDIRDLLAYGGQEPVLYVQNGPDDEGGEQTLAVWARALVPHNRVVCSREEVIDALGDGPDGGDIDDDLIEDYLPGVQDTIDEIIQTAAQNKADWADIES